MLDSTRGRAIFLARRPGALLLSLCLLVGTARALPPVVEFDLAQTAACRRVATPERAPLRPQSDVVEVVFDLSTRILAGSETDIKYINVEIRSPDRQLSLVGFLPTTTLQSESVDGVIDIEEHKAAGELSLEYGSPMAKVTAAAKNAGDSKIVEKKFAPKSLLVASGTIDHSHGVYFRLHPSTQDSLQKSRQFVCQFAVPPSFRADYVQIACSVVAVQHGVVRSMDSEVAAGLARFTVAIYLEGDSDARGAADLFAHRQQELFNQVMIHQAEIERRAENAHWWNGMTRSVGLGSHNKPASKAAELLRDAEGPAVDASLPIEVAQAARAVKAAKRALRQMNGRYSPFED